MRDDPHPDCAGRAADADILVIGGGASGAIMAAHLARLGPTLRILVAERDEAVGRGVAYGTANPVHRLNTRNANVSIWPDRPDDFVAWLRARGEPCARPEGFATRAAYGRYLADRLGDGAAPGILTGAEVVALAPGPAGWLARMADGRTVAARVAVLATGHPAAAPDPSGLLTPPGLGAAGLPPDAPVVIIGTGLTMVDEVLALTAAGHHGPVTAVSRRGLLPRAHRDGPSAPVPPGPLPLGSGAVATLRWLRGRVAAHQAAGGAWQDVLDGLRPEVARLWQHWDGQARARFLRHGTAWWDAHRFRMPADVAGVLAALAATGRLAVRRGRLAGVERADGPAELAVRVVHRGATVTLPAARVVDCRGVRHDPAAHPAPLIAGLLRQGLLSVDPLRLGFRTAGCGRALDRAGAPVPGLYLVGPITRPAWWEITGLAEIRAQAARLAPQVRAAVYRPTLTHAAHPGRCSTR